MIASQNQIRPKIVLVNLHKYAILSYWLFDRRIKRIFSEDFERWLVKSSEYRKRNFLNQRPLKLVRILVRTTNGRGVGFS
jgi:hypothetical protein